MFLYSLPPPRPSRSTANLCVAIAGACVLIIAIILIDDVALGNQMQAVINPALAPPERAEQQYPIRDILETGAEISFGSDWPVCCEGHNNDCLTRALTHRFIYHLPCSPR